MGGESWFNVTQVYVEKYICMVGGVQIQYDENVMCEKHLLNIILFPASVAVSASFSQRAQPPCRVEMKSHFLLYVSDKICYEKCT